MNEDLMCRCGHVHTQDSDREDAGCKCEDGHDWQRGYTQDELDAAVADALDEASYGADL